MGFFRKHILRFSTSAFGLIALIPAVANAAATSDFFNVTPEVPANAVHTPTDLSQIFQTGTGPYSTSMANKIYPYPMTRNGVPGAPLYNGCYNRKGNRLGNLDANNSCAAVIQANPGIAIFRLFVGYKVDCADAPFVAPTCKDMRLLMNCQYTQVQTGTGSFENYTAPVRECSAEHGIVRKANANSVITPAQTGCYPGTDGTDYPNCTDCATGTFNPDYIDNRHACTKCNDVMHIDHLDTSGPAINDSDWVSSKNLDGSASFQKSASQGDCKLKQGLPWQCETGFQKDPFEQGCVVGPSNCALSLNLTPTNPAPATANGSISASTSGNNGNVLIAMTLPTPRAPDVAGPPAIFNGLTAATYTITATDSNCSTSASVTLTETPVTPACSACPAGSTLVGSTCMTSPTTTTSPPQYGYACTGYGGCTSQTCHNQTCQQGQTFGQVSLTDTTPRVCDGNPLWTSFGGNCTRETGPTAASTTTTCPSGFTMTAGSCTMACTPTPMTPSPTPAPSLKPVKCNANWCHLGASYTSTCFTDGTNSGAVSGGSGGTNNRGESCGVADDGGAVPCADTSLCPVAPSTYMLVSGQHSPADCTALGGTVVYEGILSGTYKGTAGSLPADNGFCRFSFTTASASNACPSGWAKFRDYRSTEGSFTPAAYVQSYTRSPYSQACPLPTYASIISKNVTTADTFAYGVPVTVGSPFKNGPASSSTVNTWSYFDESCSGAPTPNPPPAPSGLAWYRYQHRFEKGIDDLIDILFPSAYAKLMCNGTLSCRQTDYTTNVQLLTKEIGCY